MKNIEKKQILKLVINHIDNHLILFNELYVHAKNEDKKLLMKKYSYLYKSSMENSFIIQKILQNGQL